MWIRSQNKDILAIINDGFIYAKLNCIYLKKLEHNDFIGIKLGEYSSKEKALKVLDMIQECIVENKANFLHSQYLEALNKPEKAFIFQMPQDDEV